MPEAVVIDCLRTAVGKANRGAREESRPDDLAATVIRELLEKYPAVAKSSVEDVILGCAMPEGEQGMNMARIAALRAGLPDTVPGVTINRFCSSGFAVDCYGGGSNSCRKRRCHSRGRQRIDEYDSDVRK